MKVKTPLAVMFSFFVLTYGLKAQETVKARLGHLNLESGLAIKGYDPVAYFTDHKAIKGKSDFRSTYKGITYQFNSRRHRELFDANPVKYEPEYGGWCAYAMGDSGEKVSIDPETFEVRNGKLYLFYNRFFINTYKSWKKDREALKLKADKNWREIVK